MAQFPPSEDPAQGPCTLPNSGRGKIWGARLASREERRGAGITRPPGPLLWEPQAEGEAQPSCWLHLDLGEASLPRLACAWSRSVRAAGRPNGSGQTRLACRVTTPSTGWWEECVGQKLRGGGGGGSYSPWEPASPVCLSWRTVHSDSVLSVMT